MTTFLPTSATTRLTPTQCEQYRNKGYLKGLPLFDTAAVRELASRFTQLCEQLPVDCEVSRVNCWHKANRWIYDLSRTPALLDYVADLLGPNFILWGSQFFAKFPHDGTVVPWHQDAQYWPLSPRRVVTAWIAIFDTDESNGAMQIVPGSHQFGPAEHRPVDGEHYILDQEIVPASFPLSEVVSLNLRAGQISLHDDGLIHGSAANGSQRMRAGLAFRYSPTEVKCDLAIWPNFESYLVRGHDDFQHNPTGKIPRQDGITTKMFPHASEFP